MVFGRPVWALRSALSNGNFLYLVSFDICVRRGFHRLFRIFSRSIYTPFLQVAIFVLRESMFIRFADMIYALPFVNMIGSFAFTASWTDRKYVDRLSICCPLVLMWSFSVTVSFAEYFTCDFVVPFAVSIVSSFCLDLPQAGARLINFGCAALSIRNVPVSCSIPSSPHEMFARAILFRVSLVCVLALLILSTTSFLTSAAI